MVNKMNEIVSNLKGRLEKGEKLTKEEYKFVNEIADLVTVTPKEYTLKDLISAEWRIINFFRGEMIKRLGSCNCATFSLADIDNLVLIASDVAAHSY